MNLGQGVKQLATLVYRIGPGRATHTWRPCRAGLHKFWIGFEPLGMRTLDAALRDSTQVVRRPPGAPNNHRAMRALCPNAPEVSRVVDCVRVLATEFRPFEVAVLRHR